MNTIPEHVEVSDTAKKLAELEAIRAARPWWQRVGLALLFWLAGIVFIFGVVLWPLVVGPIGQHIVISEGDRIGRVIKLSHEGLIWKTWEAEAVLTQGGDGSVSTYVWEFSIPNSVPNKDELLASLEESLRTGEVVSLSYTKVLVAPPWVSKTQFWFTTEKKTNATPKPGDDKGSMVPGVTEVLPGSEAVQEPDIIVSPTVSGRTINLSGQALLAVPGWVFNRRDTEVLDVSNNTLSGALPAEVRQLAGLQVLDMSDNNLTGIPAEVGQLGELQVLDVSNNPITGLPYELGNLQNLRTLDLRGTNFAAQDLAVIEAKLPSSVTILR